ncbi:MAG: hypothetical protein HY744_34135, partial [Deltaproteobacteria bacterium]|nr:hypothetical protein [Deltaproteobacteria bacterium]
MLEARQAGPEPLARHGWPRARAARGETAAGWGAPGLGEGKREYAPRRRRDTLLYRVVAEHLEPFIAHAAETYERPLPRYVVEALRGFLRCGDFERGFLRCRCEGCGHDFL